MGADKFDTQPGCYLTGQVIEAQHSRERFQTVPYKGLPARTAGERLAGAPANGIPQGSTCICLPSRSCFGEGRGIFDQP